MWSSFFPKENLIHVDHTLPHYIHILVIHCMLLLAEILLILKITLQNAKNAALQFLKKKKGSEFIAKWISNDNSDASILVTTINNFWTERDLYLLARSSWVSQKNNVPAHSRSFSIFIFIWLTNKALLYIDFSGIK